MDELELYENAPIALMLLDSNLRILSANHLGRSLINFQEGELSQLRPFNQFLGSNSIDFYEWLGGDLSVALEVSLSLEGKLVSYRLFQMRLGVVGEQKTLLALILNEEDKKYNDSLRLYQSLFESSHLGVVVMDRYQVITHYNTTFLNMMRFHFKELVGRKFCDIASKFYGEHLIDDLNQGLHNKDFWHGRLFAKGHDDTILSYELEITIVRDEQKFNRPIMAYVGFYRNIDAQLRYEEKLSAKIYLDILTGFYNRQGFLKELEAKFTQVQREGLETTLISIDIDNFKQLNEFYGNRFGDGLLQAFAQRLVASVKPEDVLGRLGGDSFGLLIVQRLSEQTLRELAVRLSQILSEPYLISNIEAKVQVSIGLATYPYHGTSADELITSSEIAVKQSQLEGKAIHQFAASQYSEKSDEYYLLEKLDECIRQRQFELYFEPIVDFKTGLVDGFSVSLKWLLDEKWQRLDEKTEKMLYQHPLIATLEPVLMEQLVNVLLEWKTKNIRSKLIVKLSLMTLTSSVFQTILTKMQAQYPKLQSIIGFSFYEEVFLNQKQALKQRVHWLHMSGFQLYLESFGDDMASIHCINPRLISGVFFSEKLVEELDDTSILVPDTLQAIMAVLDVFAVPGFAKNVTKHEQFSYLNAIGCQYVSGSYFYLPMKAMDVPSFLQQWSEQH